MKAWGFTYKTNLVWYKVRNDGGPDGRGVGFYFRNVTELILFGVRGSLRSLPPGRTQVNLFATRKREHSRKPDEIYNLIESCSPGPYLELFARFSQPGWQRWGNEDVEENSGHGVAKRSGHDGTRPRLLDSPRGYTIRPQTDANGDIAIDRKAPKRDAAMLPSPAYSRTPMRSFFNPREDHRCNAK